MGLTSVMLLADVLEVAEAELLEKEAALVIDKEREFDVLTFVVTS